MRQYRKGSIYMGDTKVLENNELETVAGGSDIESYQGFSVGDWVSFKIDGKTRRSPERGA